jgi:AmiR/NasT family two-component response regulator
MYSTTDDEVDPSAEPIAELFATHASIALGNALQIDGLTQALRTRKIIGQAIGLVMKEHTLTEDAAFGFLVRTSSHANVKLRDIAARMVAEANEKANE